MMYLKYVKEVIMKTRSKMFDVHEVPSIVFGSVHKINMLIKSNSMC